MPPFRPSDATLARLSPRALAMLPRLRAHSVESSVDPWFDRAYDVLDRYFGPRGELEARDALARVVDRPFEHRGVHVAYPLIVLEDEAGELISVLSRYMTWEPATGVLAALDGCGYTEERHRGRGTTILGLPLLLDAGRRRLAPWGAAEARRVLDLGDLEPLDPADPDAVQRATTWGRRNARVIPPSAFPLTLVGMRDERAPGGFSPPVPVLGMLADPLGEGPLAAVDKAALAVLALHMEAAHAWAGDAAGLAEQTARLLAAIAAAPEDPVPLIPLPTSPDDAEILARLYEISGPLR